MPKTSDHDLRVAKLAFFAGVERLLDTSRQVREDRDRLFKLLDPDHQEKSGRSREKVTK